MNESVKSNDPGVKADGLYHVTRALVTPDAPGAVAIIQISGPDAIALILELTGHQPSYKARLVSFANIDEGLLIQIHQGVYQIMPHGGTRVTHRILAWLDERGARPEPLCSKMNARQLYPEASSVLEALALHAITTADSDGAAQWLLRQPRCWRSFWQSKLEYDQTVIHALNQKRIMHSVLLNAPRVVVIGCANVGKSTLCNTLSGQEASITANMPGTTRDWVQRRVHIPTELGALAIDLYDMPGFRETEDAVEKQAIKLARTVLDHADLLIKLRCLDIPHLEMNLPKKIPQIALCNQWLSEAGRGQIAQQDSNEININAIDPQSIQVLGHAISMALLGNDLGGVSNELPWVFTDELWAIVQAGEGKAIHALL